MKLISISENINGGEFSNNWSLESVLLNPKVNLLVAQNATGKSRVINIIESIAETIKNAKYEFDIVDKLTINCIFLKDNGDLFEYNFILEINSKAMDIYVYEEIAINNVILLSRKPDASKIYSYKTNQFQDIDPPEDKLVLHIRRDKVEYPFLEDLYNWANRVSFFYFGKLLTSYFGRNNHNPSWLIANLNQNSIKNVIKDLNTLGYNFQDIKWEKLNERPGNIILVKESGFEKYISEHELSQGMFRSLGLLIYIENLIQSNSISAIIIDDLGEGLDYERATKLGKLLVEKIENSNIQFIATSNDSFLMDVIPIKYWNILQRDGNTVRALNYHNSKEQFDNFKFTGLSNFDLFSSDYLMRPKP